MVFSRKSPPSGIFKSHNIRFMKQWLSLKAPGLHLRQLLVTYITALQAGMFMFIVGMIAGLLGCGSWVYFLSHKMNNCGEATHLNVGPWWCCFGDNDAIGGLSSWKLTFHHLTGSQIGTSCPLVQPKFSHHPFPFYLNFLIWWVFVFLLYFPW